MQGFWKNRIQLDLLKRHIGPFLFCFFTLMFLLLMQFLILHVDKLIGKDIPIPIILELIATNLAYMVVLAAPMAVLVATLMAFGKFSELNELTALRASGVNTISIIQPVLLAAVILFGGLAWFSNYVLPEANSKARSLFIDIRLKKPGFELQPNVFYNGIEGYTFLVKHINNETDSLYDITLFQEPGNTRNRAYIKAKSGYLRSEGEQGLTLFLHNGNMVRNLSRTSITAEGNVENTAFSKYRLTFDLSDLAFTKSDPEARNRSDRSMLAQAMAVVVDTLRKEIDDYRKDITEEPIISAEHNKPVSNGSAPPQVVNKGVEAIPSDMVVLQNASNNLDQIRWINIAYSQLEKQKSDIDKTTSNILWRVKRINRYLVEIHKKLSIPFACIVFVLLGAPIGIMTRRGNFGYAAIISAVILTIYWISIIQGEKLADRLFITPFWGMWSFNIVFSLIGIILIIRLSTGFRLKHLFVRRG